MHCCLKIAVSVFMCCICRTIFLFYCLPAVQELMWTQMRCGLGGCLCHLDMVGLWSWLAEEGRRLCQGFSYCSRVRVYPGERSMKQALGQPSPPHQPCPWSLFLLGISSSRSCVCWDWWLRGDRREEKVGDVLLCDLHALSRGCPWPSASGCLCESWNAVKAG